mgnify:CR=1 FL=1
MDRRQLLTASAAAALPQEMRTAHPWAYSLMLFVGVALGAYIKGMRSLIPIIIIYWFITYITTSVSIAFVSVALIVFSWLVCAVLRHTLNNLPFPLRGLQKEGPYLLAFGAGYILTIVVFAFLYHNAYLLAPDAAFNISPSIFIKSSLNSCLLSSSFKR